MRNKPFFLIYLFATIGIFLIIGSSCKKDNDSPTRIPEVITKEIADITNLDANGGGIITSDGGASVIARGICWSTNQTPTINNFKTKDGNGGGSFTSKLTALVANTTYYVRAYATNVNGTAYGNMKSFTTKNDNITTVTDIDGNIYHTITIGTQIWMVENLKTTKYRNGDPIPNVADNTQWNNLTTDAYCNYNNDANNATIYGRLYNLSAVLDSRKICPSGWHIPSDAEWTTLIAFLGGDNVAGGKLKETGTSHWNSPNTGATNETGFTALPDGHRDYFGIFLEIGGYGHWWSSTKDDESSAWSYRMGYSYKNIGRSSSYEKNGYSVRCIKD
jgi:uncharacterized protein (TIGR02145 family)